MNEMTEQDKIHMWDRFDKIVCIHYLPYSKERKDNIVAELKRVGILDNPRFEWEYTVPIREFVKYMKLPKGEDGSKPIGGKPLQAAIHYYQMMQKWRFRGFKKVLLLEDDLAFHKDLGFIKNILDNTPEDADIANYDPLRSSTGMNGGRVRDGKYYDLRGNEVEHNQVCDSIFLRYDATVWNMSCISFSERAIERWIENIENRPTHVDRYIWKGTDGLNRYCVSMGNSIAIQNKRYEITNSRGGEAGMLQYKGLNLSNYNLPVHICELESDIENKIVEEEANDEH